MADGSFMIDLPAFNAAITQVSAERDAIQSGVSLLIGIFEDIEAHWKSPSGTSFVALADQFNAVAQKLLSTLDEAVGRMRTTYANYVGTEATNAGNLT